MTCFSYGCTQAELEPATAGFGGLVFHAADEFYTAVTIHFPFGEMANKYDLAEMNSTSLATTGVV